MTVRFPWGRVPEGEYVLAADGQIVRVLYNRDGTLALRSCPSGALNVYAAPPFDTPAAVLLFDADERMAMRALDQHFVVDVLKPHLN
jgi:hypothetical protein